MVRLEAIETTGMLQGVGTCHGAASLGTAATPFAEAQSVPPNRGRRVARPEPSAKGVVVRFRGYRETVMAGRCGHLQSCVAPAPPPRPSPRLRACHPTAVGRVARPEPSAKGVVVRPRGY